jgi:hypothetical protein
MYSDKQKYPRKFNLGPSIGAVRGLQRIQSTQRPAQSSYTPGNKIFIEFPSEHLYLKDSYMTFNAIVTDSTTPGVGGAAFQFPISTIFSKVRVLQGSEVYCDVNDYASWKGNLSNGWSAGLASGQEIVGLKMEGSTVLATRQTDSLVDCVYSCKLDLDILRQYIPAKFMNSEFKIELTLAQPRDALYDDAAAPDSTYTVSNVVYHYDVLVLPAEIEDKIRASVMSEGYKLYYCGIDQNASGQLGTGTATDLQIPVNRETVRRVLAIIRLQADINSDTEDNKFRLYDSNINTIDRASLKVNSQIIPPDEISELSADAQNNHWVLFRMWADTFNDFHGARDRAYDCLAANVWKSGSAQCLAFDLRKQPDSPDILNNGMTLNKAGSMMVLRLRFGSGYASNALITSFVEYECCAVVKGGRVDIKN